MKNFTFLMFALILSVSLSAFNSESKLKLRMWDHSSFTIEFNGKYFPNSTNIFEASNLVAGSHKIKVFKLFYGTYGYSSNRVLIFNGYINIPASSKLVAKIDRYNNFSIVKIEPVFNDYYYNENESYNNNYNQAYSSCMSSYTFANIKQLMINNAFDSSRLKMAKQAIASNSICSQQVSELMNLLSFESSKLELAKFAYNYTSDKENYFIVNNAFTFSSSIDSLNKYIYGN